jgi:hypothetical protein
MRNDWLQGDRVGRRWRKLLLSSLNKRVRELTRPQLLSGRPLGPTSTLTDELLFAELAALTTVRMGTKRGTKMTSVSEVF